MADTRTIAADVVAALNARDFSALAEAVHEDVAIAGIGEGMDNGREALRDRLARHFQAFDESYGDQLAMSDAAGDNVAVKLTARGKDSASGRAYSVDKVLLFAFEDGLITRIVLFSQA